MWRDVKSSPDDRAFQEQNMAERCEDFGVDETDCYGDDPGGSGLFPSRFYT